MNKSMETSKITKAALCFDEINSIKLAANDGGKVQLFMTAYSGKLIKNHWYWGDLAIDVSGMKMAKSKIPILNDHMTNEKIGFGESMVTKENTIEVTDATFLDTPFADDFIKNSQAGFPYEASIYAHPTKIQRLMEKEETMVNGFTMKGPGTIWRESVLKECSVVVFGADSNTKSAAMSEAEELTIEVEGNKLMKKEEIMDKEKLKAEHPSVYEEIFGLGKTEAEQKFVEIKASLDSSIQTLSAENTQLKADKDKLSAEGVTLGNRVLALEKAGTIAKEQSLKASADTIFAAQMKSHPGIPVRLHSKIRKQLNHEAFIKDEVLDETAFTAAVATELKDWAPAEGEETVLGMGMVADGAALTEEAIAARMFKHVSNTTH